jgi:hypothetical protein
MHPSCDTDYESFASIDFGDQKSCGAESGLVLFSPVGPVEGEDIPLYGVGARVESVAKLCRGLFPSYFKVVFRIIGQLKTSKDSLEKVSLSVSVSVSISLNHFSSLSFSFSLDSSYSACVAYEQHGRVDAASFGWIESSFEARAEDCRGPRTVPQAVHRVHV